MSRVDLRECPGDWQFLHYDEADEDDDDLRNPADLMLVHFHHVVDRFPEVEELSDLPVG